MQKRVTLFRSISARLGPELDGLWCRQAVILKADHDRLIQVQSMSSASSVAATLRPETRQQLAIEALAKSKPISHLAADYEVSRKFVYDRARKPNRR